VKPPGKEELRRRRKGKGKKGGCKKKYGNKVSVLKKKNSYSRNSPSDFFKAQVKVQLKEETREEKRFSYSSISNLF
jgi:hypothetical protein